VHDPAISINIGAIPADRFTVTVLLSNFGAKLRCLKINNGLKFKKKLEMRGKA